MRSRLRDSGNPENIAGGGAYGEHEQLHGGWGGTYGPGLVEVGLNGKGTEATVSQDLQDIPAEESLPKATIQS
jgi:hypothetical protein